MVVRIRGVRMYLWRAVDDEGEVLDMLVQKRRNTRAALRLMRKLLKDSGVRPTSIVTDGLGSYGAAARALNLSERHHPGRMRENNRCENSHLPIRRRERKMQRFKARAQLKDSSPCMPAYTTFSTPSVISPHDPSCGSSEGWPIRHGPARQLPHERLRPNRSRTRPTF